MQNHQPALPACLLAGAAAGFINGFFGAGGGMVLVPLLIHVAKLPDKQAFSSAIGVILPLCLVSLAVYSMRGMLPLQQAIPYLIGGAAGGFLGGLLFKKVSARLLHLTLGAGIILGGVRLLLC